MKLITSFAFVVREAVEPDSPDGHRAISEPCPASPIKKLPHMVSLFLSLHFMLWKIMMIFSDHILKLKRKQLFLSLSRAV